VKVNDEAIDWELAFEFQSGQAAITQAEPERPLGIGLIATQAASGGRFATHETPSPPHPNPLPFGEREPNAVVASDETASSSSNHALLAYARNRRVRERLLQPRIDLARETLDPAHGLIVLQKTRLPHDQEMPEAAHMVVHPLDLGKN